jgi:hypothetical protein
MNPLNKFSFNYCMFKLSKMINEPKIIELLEKISKIVFLRIFFSELINKM